MPIYAEPINISGITGMMQYANTVSNSWFGILLLIGIYSVIMLVNLARDKHSAAAAAGYSTAVFAVLFRIIEIITDWQMYIFIVLCAFSVIWATLNNE